MIGAKPLCIRFDKIVEFIRINDGNRYLVLLATEKYDTIYNKIRCLISPKSNIAYVFFSLFLTKIKVDSYDSLPIEKNIDLHNAIIVIKSVLNKDQNHCCYNIFLEKLSHQLAEK